VAERIIDTLVTVFGFRTDRTQLEAAQKNIQSVRKGLDNMARNIGIAGAAASAALFGVGRTLLDFEAAQNRIAATFLDEPIDQLSRLRAQARELGAATSKSATEAANAQLELARAGLSLNQVLDATPIVLNLAIAGELEMGEAASLVTSQLHSFGLEIDQTARVADVLAATATRSNTDVRRLGPALRQISALAASAGFSIEQTAAAIGLLRDGGLRAEAAGTALRGVLARLLDVSPPDEFVATLNRLGINLEEIQAVIATGNLSGAMRMLGAAGMNTADAIALFGNEAANAATILAGRAGDLEAFETELANVGGTADQMRQRIESGLPGAWAQMKASFEEMQLAMGDAGVTGQLKDLMGVATGFFRWMGNDAPGWVRTLTGSLAALTVALLGLGFILKAASFALGAYSFLLGPLSWLHTMWTASTWGTRVGLFALNIQTWAAVAAQTVYQGALKATAFFSTLASRATWRFTLALLANPITWVVAAIAALIAGLVLLIVHWDKVSAAITRAWGVVKDAMMAAWNWVKNNWPLLLAILTGPFGAAVYFIVRFKDNIIGAVMTVVGWVKENWPKLLAILGGPFTAIGYLVYRFRDTIVGVLQGLWGWIAGLMGKLTGWSSDTTANVLLW